MASADQSVLASGAMSSAAAFQTGRASDRFTELIAMADVSIGAILAAMLIAFVWGAAHAFSPGHGKTILAAYLVGSRATVRHALFLGATTTITHTTGVFALGLVTLFASRYILPEQLFPWLEVISGLLLVALGVSLFVNRLQRAIRPNLAGLDHGHDHSHDHDHHHDHHHAHGHDHHHPHEHHHHSHLPPGSNDAPVTWRSLLALGISGGLLPCPSALVVLLSAIALHRVAFGMLLIVAFSIGLAGVLTGIGLLLVYARRLFERLPTDGRLLRALPVASAAFVTLAGVVIAAGALVQAGVLRV
jgi:ABC-type nickel/cobalt efflux system permease component RcnA